MLPGARHGPDNVPLPDTGRTAVRTSDYGLGRGSDKHSLDGHGRARFGASHAVVWFLHTFPLVS